MIYHADAYFYLSFWLGRTAIGRRSQSSTKNTSLLLLHLAAKLQPEIAYIEATHR